MKRFYTRKKMELFVRDKTFSIICNNCWGGHIYQELGIPYRTPTVGLFMYMPCYISFLENLEQYLSSEITFIEKSKYPIANTKREIDWYPIGLLDDKIEVHFLHYKSIREAAEKWNKRKARVNFENLFVVGSERDLCDENLIARFLNLDFKNKIFFTAKNYGDKNGLLHISEYEQKGEVGDIYTRNELIHKHLDVVKWLNSGSYLK